MSIEAMYYEQSGDDLQCLLCPHNCLIKNGKTGICQVRRNTGGKLIAETWGNLSGINFDPVEKKPLYHFYPGRLILSLGSAGCNMSCKCCQNWQISQTSSNGFRFDRSLIPMDIIRMATSRKENIGVAYTYNEPTVWFEYMNDIARLVRFKGLKNVMVSNGYISEEPLHDLLSYIDAFNIDLKGFSDDFYRRFAGASLSPVLRSLKQIRNAGKHLEITFLVIPTLNDDSVTFSEMIRWIAGELGSNTVLHLSRYHPAHKLEIDSTPASKLNTLYEMARKELTYVYLGNIQIKDYQHTKCGVCGSIVISRHGYQVNTSALTSQGNCKNCGSPVINY